MGRFFLSVAFLGFAVYTAGTALTQVQPGERAVIRRFGRILPQQPEQGLYIGWPWGIDRVERVQVGLERRISVGYRDNEDQEEVVPAGQMLTGDHNLVNVQAEIYFKVREGEVEKFVLQASLSDALVARAAESLLAEWIAGRTVDEVLLRGKIELPRFLREQMENRLRPYDLGIEIQPATSIPQLQSPAEVKEAFDRLGQVHSIVETRLKQAQREADRLKSELAAQTYQRQSLARSYADDQHRKATAEAQSFRQRLAQYRTLSATNPDYLNSLWLDDMTRLYAKMRAAGQIELLDHYLSGDGLSITQFPLQGKKK